MLQLIIFLVVMALLSAILGFGGMAGSFMHAAQFLFYILIVLLVVAMIYQILTGRRPPKL